MSLENAIQQLKLSVDRLNETLEREQQRKDVRLMRLPEVADLLKTHRSVIYLWIKEGRFPSPLMVASRSPRWLRREVEAWIVGKWRESQQEDEE